MPKSKPPPEDDLELGGQGGTGEPPAGDPATGAPALTPDHIRNSPEYRELQRQNRTLARENGSLRQQTAQARTAAEQAAQAAEAERIAAQESRVRQLLGDDGVNAWNELADLQTTDPVAAAERFAQYVATRGQTPAQAASGQQQATGGTEVPQQQPSQGQPPATGLSRTVGDVPLNGGEADPTAEVISGLEQRYADTVARVQDPVTRNRVTMRERAGAMIGFIGAAYLKAGAKPK